MKEFIILWLISGFLTCIYCFYDDYIRYKTSNSFTIEILLIYLSAIPLGLLGILLLFNEIYKYSWWNIDIGELIKDIMNIELFKIENN